MIINYDIKKSGTLVLLIITTVLGFLICSSNINKTDQVRKAFKGSGALEALELWNDARAYPNEEISPNAFWSAYEKIQKKIINKSQNISIDQWRSIGPHNTGGRTNAIAFNPQNPNTLYVGSASGGLWRSYTAGVGIDAWKYVPTGFPVLGVSSIEIVPDDSNSIYIGTGEVYNSEGAGSGSAYRRLRGTYGIGILKTTDSGLSWFKSLDWSYQSQRGVWAVRVNPLNPNTVYANTTEGVYRSYDAGLIWQQVNNIIMGIDLEINPVDTNIILASHGNFASTGYGIYRSSDSGNTWEKMIVGLPTTYQGKVLLDIYKANPNIVYASIGHGFLTGYGASWLCKSSDSGLSWTILNQTDYSQHQGWFSHDVAIDQYNPNNLIVAGISVWKSTDGGLNLVQKSDGGVNLGRPPVGGPDGEPNYTHCDVHTVIQHPIHQNTFYIGTDGGIFRTTDLGETFAACNGRYQTTQFYNGTSSSALDSMKVLGGLQDNATVIYDGDLAWTRVVGRDGSWTSIDPSNDNNIYASWQSLNIFCSTDGGINFSDITPPSSIKTSFIAPFKSFAGNHAIIYAGRDKIFKSINSGSNWAVTNNNSTLDASSAIAMEISYQSGEKVYIATSPYGTSRGHIFRTTNGGISYTNITNNLPDRYPADLAVNPYNDNIVYVSFFGFGSGHIFKSMNSGDGWTDISDNLPDIPATAVIVDPNNTNHVYLGTDVGVFISTSGGGNWFTFNDGLPDVVQVMDLNYSKVNNMIRVMSHGNGAYERKFISQSNPSAFQFAVTINDAWNVVSIPGFNPIDQNVNTWWAFRDIGADVMRYAGDYQSVAYVIPGIGYWMKHSGTRTYNTGDEWPAGGIQSVVHEAIDAVSGWNLIGGYEDTVSAYGITTTPSGLQEGVVWKYSEGYYIADYLIPGIGYWIKLTSVGLINIPEHSVKRNEEKVEWFKADWGTILFSDYANRTISLYAANSNVELKNYELPPIPPAGMFDIRYQSGRIAEDINSEMKTVEMQGIVYPMTVKVKGMNIRLMDESGKNLNVHLKTGEEIVINDSKISKLKVKGELVPVVYSLEQNYPNPFNPSTVIKLSLPEDVENVKLSIYNVLGEKVAELVNASLIAGKYNYTWNAQNFATGVYIYELRTSKVVLARKMLLKK